MDSDWDSLIRELKCIRTLVEKADTEHLYEYFSPYASVPEKEIQEVEQLKESLNEQYRSFLLKAGGWPAFFQAIELFSPQDLLSGERHKRALILVSYLDNENVFEFEGLNSNDFLPIAVSSVDLDVFVLGREGSSVAGQVFWFAAYLIEKYPSFMEFFRAVIELHKDQLQDFSNRNGF